MTDIHIIEKIKNLLALAKDTSNPNESAVAFAVAQKLLSTHQLDLAEIEVATGVKQADEQIEDNNTPLYVGKRVILWKDILANELSKLNSCKMYVNKTRHSYNQVGTQIAYRVIGRKSDVEVVRYFFESIVAQIEFLSDNAIKQGKGRGKSFTNSFKHGAAQVVIERLKTTQQEIRATHTSSALVLVDNKALEVKKWVEEHIQLKAKKINYNSNNDLDGYYIGREAGKNVSLNKAMPSSNSSNKLFE